MKNVAGAWYLSSNRRIRGSPERAPYSLWAIRAGEVRPSLKDGVSLSKSNERPTATRAPRGQRLGVRSRPALTRLTVSKTLLSGHFQEGSCCCAIAVPIIRIARDRKSVV